MEYTTIVLKLDDASRPPLQKDGTSKREKGESIRAQQEWFERATKAVRERAQCIGCVALSQLWMSGELMIAVPNDGFDEKVESLCDVEYVTSHRSYDFNKLRT